MQMLGNIRKPFSILVLALPMLAWFSALAMAADARVQLGAGVVKRWCAECHVTSAGQLAGSDQAPAFQAIANDTEKNDTYLRGWLIEPHGEMPQLNLTRVEIDAILAYFGSLRPESKSE